MKNTLLFTYSTNLLVRANRKYEQLSNPQNRKMCDPILVTLLKMQHHYSQSSRENATPSGSASLSVDDKEVSPPLPPPGLSCVLEISHIAGYWLFVFVFLLTSTFSRLIKTQKSTWLISNQLDLMSISSSKLS